MPASDDLNWINLRKKTGCDCHITISTSEAGDIVVVHEGTAPIVVPPEDQWTSNVIERLKKAHERVTLRNMAREAHLLGEDD